MLRDVILGINLEGASFESFQTTNSKKKVGTSTWRTFKKRYRLRSTKANKTN